LKESGEIEQDASIVAFLHRPEYYGETETFNGSSATDICEFIIGKNREGELGIFEMSVNLATSKFNG
jgi:replicative DNA helicase